MAMRTRIFLALAALLIGAAGCAGVRSRQGALRVTGGQRVIYACEGGERIIATYYSLSDGSLDFVKISLPDGTERTLPRVLAASGVRYTDDFDLVWWTKGETAFAETRGEDGQWRILCSNCRVVDSGE